MLLDWCLFIAIFFYFPDLEPPGLVQRVMIDLLIVLTFPFVLIVFLFKEEPPYFLSTMGVLFLLSALFWATALERLRYLFRRMSHDSPATAPGSKEEFERLLDEHRKTNC
jgi:hypothetical protein